MLSNFLLPVFGDVLTCGPAERTAFIRAKVA